MRTRRTALAIGAAGALAAALIGIGATAQAATLFSDDFEDGNATGWTTSGGSWSVVSDGTQAYRQSGTSSDARARAGQTSWTDYVVTARVKPLAFNGTNRFVALLARAQSNTSYYYLALRSNNTVELKKLVSGSGTTLASAPVTVTLNTWYSLSLQVSGATLRATVNGGTPLTASDGQFAAGQVGLATFNASASFDDVRVDTVGSPTPPVTPSVTPSVTPTATPTVTPTQTGTPPPAGQPDGFASVNALGQNGTTGGAGGPTVTATTTEQFLQYIDTIGPMTILLQGTVTFDSKRGVRPNKTILGVGTSAVISGGGLDFYRSFNVIVRNITFIGADDDAVNVGQESHHIWIDHNRFVAPIDGSIDIVRGADYVTVSWNHFDHTDKTMLISHSDGAASSDIGHLKVTIHHNFFDHSRQRHPRVRFAEPVHVYNNYLLGNELYGIASTMDGGVLAEANYFQDVPFPFFARSGYADSGPGRLVARNNVFVNCGDSTSELNGTVAEPGAWYGYRLDSPSSLPSLVPAGVGVGHI